MPASENGPNWWPGGAAGIMPDVRRSASLRGGGASRVRRASRVPMRSSTAPKWSGAAAAVCAALMCFATTSAVAQAPADAAVEGSGEPEVVEARETTRLSPPSVDISALDTRWQVLREASPGTDAEARAFNALLTSAVELGLMDLPGHSLVLLQEAAVAHAAGDDARADQLREWAATLSPGSAQPFFFDARRAWEQHPWDVPGITATLAEAYGRLNTSLAGRAALGMRWRALRIFSSVMFVLALALVLAFRHGSVLAYDLRVAAQKTLTLRQSAALSALLFLAPAAIVWSPLIFVLTVIVLTAPHFSWRECLVTVAALGLCILVPSGTEEYARLMAANEGNAARVISAVVSPCDERCVGQLDDRIARLGDENAALAKAWGHYRRGTHTQRRLAAELLEGRTFSPAAQASAEVLRGNLAYVVDDPGGAEAHYLRAHDLAVTSTQRAAALFNLYRLHSADGRRAAAEEALSSALREDSALVNRQVDFRGRSQNLILAVSPTLSDVMADELLTATDRPVIEDATRELLRPWYGALDVAATRSAVGGAVIWVALWGLLGRFRWTSIRCRECATPVSRYVSMPAYRERRCVLCYQFRSIPAVLTQDQRRAREERSERWEVFWEQLELLTTIAFPGAGQLGVGRTLVGTLLLAAVCVGAVAVALPGYGLVVPYSIGAGSLFDGRFQAGAAVLGLAYVVSVADYAIRRRKAS